MYSHHTESVVGSSETLLSCFVHMCGFVCVCVCVKYTLVTGLLVSCALTGFSVVSLAA